MNDLGTFRVPFLFLVDFEMKEVIVRTLDQIGSEIIYRFGDFTNEHDKSKPSKPESIHFSKQAIPFDEYSRAFNYVKTNINYGNSFLLNLAFSTKIETNYNLEDIYWNTEAKFKMFWKDRFTFFSPERFVRISDQRIYSNPMKGTIDAAILNAKEKILSDKKEMAEHYTIVDLIRNDLSRVAKNVTVDRFRYIDKLKTNDKELLQVSSEISGLLDPDYYSQLGTIFHNLLPAGSISGAPKDKTLEIIRKAEGIKRGYYTGIFGLFDGKTVDSAVCIRFIEKSGKNLLYKSGCGITNLSDARSEYQEMIDKVYLPLI